jgi:1-deoxy-D-xylulose-5-phosphate reductoisomerase
LIILGSTGSIGVNALHIAKQFSLPVEVLVAGNNIALLNKQIAEFQPKYVVVANKESVSSVAHKNVFYGEEGILDVMHKSSSELVVNSLVGFTGLRPTIEAIKLQKRVALANKESLVVAGQFIDMSYIHPIDSEHFGLWYLLQDRPVRKMTVTASGGSFRDTPLEILEKATVEEALNHPNWSMGRKITIDSATMTNKLFELLEAKWLFDIDYLDAIIETKSIIHALVDFKDGSTTAHIAHADMKLPIAFALLGQVDEVILEPVDLLKVGSLEFREIDPLRYPIWEIKDEILLNPYLGAVINAANEIAIEQFFEGEIGFMDISRKTLTAYRKFENFKPVKLDDIFEIDKEVRNFTRLHKV